jgi:hypothetical protein
MVVKFADLTLPPSDSSENYFSIIFKHMQNKNQLLNQIFFYSVKKSAERYWNNNC